MPLTQAQRAACAHVLARCGAALAEWGRRRVRPAAAALLATAAAPWPPRAAPAVHGMASAALLPRPALCGAALARLLVNAAASAGAAGAPSAEAAELRRRLDEMAVAGVGLGLALSAALLMEEARPGLVGGADGAAVGRVLEDMGGDGEHCWELLLTASVPALAGSLCREELSRLVAAAASGGAGGVGEEPPASGDAAALAGWAVAQVCEQSVGWRVLARAAAAGLA